MKNENTMTVKEAAKRFAVGEETIRAGLISGTLPIGSAVKCKKRYAFIIPRRLVDAWESGANLSSKVRESPP